MIRLAILVLFSTLIVSCSKKDITDSVYTDENNSYIVIAEDFRILEGEPWSGELEYLNYGSDQRSTIPVGLIVKVIDAETIQFAIRYPGEESHNEITKLLISKNGREFDGKTITKRRESTNAIIFHTSGTGKDDNRNARIEMIYKLSSNEISIKKLIQYNDEDQFFTRNEYRLTR
ncbi:MAG: hypothetical protein ACWA5L_06140 [bacterium]